jgi:hypothetical protein
MKKNVMKTMVATVCVVATGMGGMKAYNAVNLSKTDMLFAENVEALSAGEVEVGTPIPCPEAPTHCRVAPHTYIVGWRNVNF